MGLALMMIGWLVCMVGFVMILIAAFKESVGWGLGCLLVPLVALIFVIMHWQETKKAFFIYLAGVPLMVIGAVLMAGSMATEFENQLEPLDHESAE